MNKDTLWLQVPAAKLQRNNFARPDSSHNKLKTIAVKLARLQNLNSPSLNKTNITFFIARQGIEHHSRNSPIQSPHVNLSNNYFSSAGNCNTEKNKKASRLELINLGKKENCFPDNGVIHSTIATSTEDFTRAPAMNKEQLAKAINIGRQTAQRINISGSHLFIASEINPSNQTSALAITYALLDILPEELTLNSDRKISEKTDKLVQKALAQHKKNFSSALEILRCLGSFEIAALTGSYLCSAHIGMPVLITGFTSAVAALITKQLCPDADRWFLYSHSSDYAPYKLVLDALNAKPLLQVEYSIDNFTAIDSALSLLHLADRKSVV